MKFNRLHFCGFLRYFSWQIALPPEPNNVAARLLEHLDNGHQGLYIHQLDIETVRNNCTCSLLVSSYYVDLFKF